MALNIINLLLTQNWPTFKYDLQNGNFVHLPNTYNPTIDCGFFDKTNRLPFFETAIIGRPDAASAFNFIKFVFICKEFFDLIIDNNI